MIDSGSGRELPYISIVIPTFNRVALLSDCLKSLFEQDYPAEKFEVIIIDDGSRDGTGAVLSRNFNGHKGKIRYYRTEENKGAAAARNTGFGKSVGELIASLDDDCQVEKSWLRDIVATLDYFPYASAVGGSIVNPTDSSIAYASYMLEFSSWFPFGPMRQVKSIPTCNIAYKRSAIKGLTFPEQFKGSVYEDTLFNHYLSSAGGVIIFNPKIKVYHYKWAQGFTKKDFYESQARYATGFLKGGYTAHGVWGRILIKYRVINLLCPRLILIFLRCAKDRIYLLQFIRNCRLILMGEWSRNKMIFRALRVR